MTFHLRVKKQNLSKCFSFVYFLSLVLIVLFVCLFVVVVVVVVAEFFFFFFFWGGGGGGRGGGGVFRFVLNFFSLLFVMIIDTRSKTELYFLQRSTAISAFIRLIYYNK